MKLFKNLIEREEKHHVPKPLHNHNIKNDLRARMVDWMVEVISIFGKSQETYFLWVYILDNFLAKTTDIGEGTDVHLLGLASMLVASKYSDLDPLCLQEICGKIGHNAFGPKKIQKKELEIVKWFSYDVEIITPLHFVSMMMFLLKKQLNCQESKKLFDSLEDAATQYAKMTVINTDLLKYRPSEIAFGAFANACNYVFNDEKFKLDKTKIQAIVGFFQNLVKQDIFNYWNIENVELDISNHLEQFESDFTFCPNAQKFSLI